MLYKFSVTRVVGLSSPRPAPNPAMRGTMRAAVYALQHRPNAVMICATHLQIKAIPMAHRIFAFSKGRIEQTLPPMGQYCPPASRFCDISDGLTLAPIGTQVCCHSGRKMRRLAAPAHRAKP